MSRTFRSLPKPKAYYRKPQTASTIRQNEGLLHDIRVGDIELPISGVNRMRRYIPTAWDDIPYSCRFEDYRHSFKHNSPFS